MRGLENTTQRIEITATDWVGRPVSFFLNVVGDIRYFLDGRRLHSGEIVPVDADLEVRFLSPIALEAGLIAGTAADAFLHQYPRRIGRIIQSPSDTRSVEIEPDRWLSGGRTIGKACGRNHGDDKGKGAAISFVSGHHGQFQALSGGVLQKHNARTASGN